MKKILGYLDGLRGWTWRGCTLRVPSFPRENQKGRYRAAFPKGMKFNTLLLLAAMGFDLSTDAPVTFRVKDINQADAFSPFGGIGAVGGMGAGDGVLFFNGFDPASGFELWKSDGALTAHSSSEICSQVPEVPGLVL